MCSKLDAEKKAAKRNCVEKIITHFRKLSKVYKNIADKYSNLDDILKLTFTSMKILVNIKHESEDDSILTTKKDLS